ncbi:protein CutA 1, chloroplastic isoform X3 [Dioscorea cayenensis subsp. rotundata]|uniref:Protein CutA 1, chloroplastic isoform X3 n=1 Tax=Dioscorea cayennensis subsp. rotundata TaxID=55577 RepID=A0AB40BHD9_DIOCR|nr:protein CutA 1, chloroplastic isoform X3 [Dioscorea cayenensis subsp. rotundata]
MALLSLLRFPSASASPPPYSHRRNIATTALLRRRAPLVGALWVLSLGTFTTFACRTGSKGRTLHSTAMASASTTVPSIVVYVTVPNKEAGKKLSESIIKERLAACVNRVPGIESVYWWDGKVQSDAEELLIIKTRESLLNALTEHVKANHEYDLPEVIALPIKGGNEKYLEWIKNSTKDE